MAYNALHHQCTSLCLTPNLVSDIFLNILFTHFTPATLTFHSSTILVSQHSVPSSEPLDLASPLPEKKSNPRWRSKDVRSSSARTPKLQLVAEQPLTGECWIPPKKKIPHIQQQRRSPSKTVGGAKSHIKSNPKHQRCSEGSNKILCSPGDPTEMEPDMPLTV